MVGTVARMMTFLGWFFLFFFHELIFFCRSLGGLGYSFSTRMGSVPEVISFPYKFIYIVRCTIASKLSYQIIHKLSRTSMSCNSAHEVTTSWCSCRALHDSHRQRNKVNQVSSSKESRISVNHCNLPETYTFGGAFCVKQLLAGNRQYAFVHNK